MLGFVALAWGLANNANWIALSWGAGMLLAGAPLLGFAKIIDLLEDIAHNTGTQGMVTSSSKLVDPAVAEFVRRRDALSGKEGGISP